MTLVEHAKGAVHCIMQGCLYEGSWRKLLLTPSIRKSCSSEYLVVDLVDMELLALAPRKLRAELVIPF